MTPTNNCCPTRPCSDACYYLTAEFCACHPRHTKATTKESWENSAVGERIKECVQINPNDWPWVKASIDTLLASERIALKERIEKLKKL